MKRTIVRQLGVVSVIIVLIGISVLSATLIARARQNTPYVLTSQTVPLVSHARSLGAPSAQQQLNLSIGLQLRNQQELNALLSDLYNPHSPTYHHFLTPQQFVDAFGPTADQRQQVIDYLRQAGLKITHVASNGLLIDASATVAQAEAAFHVAIKTYQAGTRVFYANATPPIIPGSLASIVASIGGLDNSVQMRPLHQHVQQGDENTRSTPGNKPHSTHAQSQTVTVVAYAPSDLHGAYDATPLLQAGIQGANQTVAVFELDGYPGSDVTQYFQAYNLGNPSITNVLVDGFNGSAGANAVEVDLDIEVVAAMAPKAAQIVYEGPNTAQGINDTYNQIVIDNKAQITTISWELCESKTGPAELQTLDNIFSQGAAEGIAMYAASGDTGAYDCWDTNLAVSSPASDPNITGVGGTSLQLNNGAYGSESVWSNPSDTQRSPLGSGGGGGISSFFKQPSWQTGPGVQNQYSNGNREVPDVSADADPNTGYSVYCTVAASGCPSNGWIIMGGTSAAAPLWAGSTALINEYLQQQQKSRIGFANPVLYGLQNASQQFPPFHDITSGNNLYYPATAGYDEASGWGSPDIYNIARDVAGGTPPPPPTPTPVPSPTSTTTPTPTPTPGPGTVPVSLHWFFGEGRVGAGFTEWLTLGNPTSTSCQVDLLYHATSDGGVSTSKALVDIVPASTRVTHSVNQDLGIFPTSGGSSVSTTVTVDTTATPLCSGIVAERPIYNTTFGNPLGVNSGTDVIGATQTGTNFYFADVRSGAQPGGGSVQSFIPILNPGASTANVKATYYAGGIQVGVQTLTVPAGTRGTIYPGRPTGFLPARVAAWVTSDQPVLVERPSYFNQVVAGHAGTVSGEADVLGVQQPATDFLFAEGYTGGQFQEYLVLANFDPAADSNATLLLEYANGAKFSFPVNIPHRAQTTLDINALTANPAAFSGTCLTTSNCVTTQDVSMEVTAASPFVAERELFFHYSHNANGRSLSTTGVSDVIGQVGPAAATAYSFAEGYTNAGYDEWLTLQNPTGSPESITVTLANGDGHTYTFQVTVGPNTRATVDITAMVVQHLLIPGDSFKGYEVSMSLSGNGAFVAERPMYFNASGYQGGDDQIGYTGG